MIKLKTALIGNLVLLSTLILPISTVKAQGFPNQDTIAQNSNAYPQEIRQIFVDGCMEGKGEEFEPFCSCMLDEFQNKYSLEEFLAFSMSMAEQGDTISPEMEETINDVSMACYGEYPQ